MNSIKKIVNYISDKIFLENCLIKLCFEVKLYHIIIILLKSASFPFPRFLSTSPCHRHFQDLIQAHDKGFPSHLSKLTLAFPSLY